MSSRQLVEIDTNLILAEIRSKIVGALADTRAERNNPLVTTEPPLAGSYFIYPTAAGYKAPAIFVVAESMDFKKVENKANFIAAVTKIKVSALVEDKDRDRVTRKAWRYQAALHEILDQTRLTSADLTVTLIIVVTNAQFSPPFIQDGTPQGVFRKEVMLECDVNHFENF